MALQAETTCIRCGKTRIFFRQWKERLDGKGAMIIHYESVCPDAECQKIVDEKFAAMKRQRDASEQKKRDIVVGRKPKSVPDNKAL